MTTDNGKQTILLCLYVTTSLTFTVLRIALENPSLKLYATKVAVDPDLAEWSPALFLVFLEGCCKLCLSFDLFVASGKQAPTTLIIILRHLQIFEILRLAISQMGESGLHGLLEACIEGHLSY